MDKEIWKSIKGYNDYYEVSNFGRVKSLPRYSFNGKFYKGKILKLRYLKLKYAYVTLYKDKYHKNYTVHRLVAMHFLENFQNKLEVNHIDGVKTNNCIENLEWVTSSENQLHAYQLGLYSLPESKGIKNGNRKLTEEDIYKIRELCANKINKKIIATKFNVHVSTIFRINSRKIWGHLA